MILYFFKAAAIKHNHLISHIFLLFLTTFLAVTDPLAPALLSVLLLVLLLFFPRFFFLAVAAPLAPAPYSTPLFLLVALLFLIDVKDVYS